MDGFTKNDETVNDEVQKEVILAYHEVINQLKLVNNGLSEEGMTTEEDEEKDLKNNVVELASKETVDGLAKKIAEFKLSISKTLDDIKLKLMGEYEKFYTLRQAITICEEELVNHYDIKKNINTLSALILAQKEKKEAFEKEMLENRRALDNERNQIEKERIREQNEYMQKRDAMRKREQEQYEIDRRALYQELLESRRTLEEDFEAREAGLAARENEHQQLKEREARIMAREQEFAQLKEKEMRFPEELRHAVQKAEATINDQLTRKFEYDVKLSQIEWDSERKLYLQKIDALEQQIDQYKKLKELFT